MAASITDKITDTRNAARPTSAAVSTARAIGGANLACNGLTGWPTDSKVHFVTYQVDTNNNPVAGSQLDCSGIVSSSTITNLEIIDGVDGGNSVGDIVEMLPTAAWGQDLADALTLEHDREGNHTVAAAASLKAFIGNLMYPIGSIYSNTTDSTDPATLLGFGTWTALENRVLVGKGSGTFASAGATGGAETHTLTTTELAAHTHTENPSLYADSSVASGTNFMANNGATRWLNATAGAGFGARPALSTASTGSGTAHNNLQPYIVVYMWQRTA